MSESEALEWEWGLVWDLVWEVAGEESPSGWERASESGFASEGAESVEVSAGGTSGTARE